MSLWSFLRGLWPWRKRPQPEPPRPEQQPAPEAAVPEDAAVVPTPAEAPPVDVAPVEAPSSEAPAPEAAEPAEPPHDEAVEPVETPAEADAVEPEPEAAVEPEEALAEEEDEDGGWEDEEVEDPDAPDPFITGAVEDGSADADLAELRASARATALSGEQRIYMSMPAGPGSLTEALEQLAAEGLVTSEFVSDGEDGPHILYRPVA